MDEENKNSIKHENVRRAIEVSSYAIKNLRLMERDLVEEKTLSSLEDLLLKSTKKLTELINN